MFYLQHSRTNLLAAHDSEGEHDGKTTYTIEAAREFESRGEASEFGQNFGPDWFVAEY